VIYINQQKIIKKVIEKKLSALYPVFIHQGFKDLSRSIQSPDWKRGVM